MDKNREKVKVEQANGKLFLSLQEKWFLILTQEKYLQW